MSTGSTLTSGGDPANSSTTLGRKLLVHVAENGHSFEFGCDGSTLIEAISLSIQSLTGISISDQLLLCGHVSLDLSHPLSFYKLPQDEREVFLYNKSRLHADSPLPDPEIIEIPNTPLPPPPSSTPPIDTRSMDPALKALVSYEHQFRYHFQMANSVYNTSKTRFEVCKRLVREQMVQERALETARENLELTFRKLQIRYSDFLKCFSRQHKGHAEILNNFERDLDKLKKIKLHEKLQREGRRVLGDLVKENELRKCAQVCVGSHRQFEGKVLQLKSNFAELRKKVESLFESMSVNGAKELDGLVKEHQRVVNEQKSIMQALSKDVETSKKLVDECLHTPPLSSSLMRAHDAVSAVGRIYEVHEKSHLPKMHSSAQSLSSLLASLVRTKNKANELVHRSMQKVKVVQFGIKNTVSELHAFQEVVMHQEREFESLRLVSGVGLGYKACLAEVVRRREGGKLYLGLAGQLAERLAVERENEIRRREAFFKNWGRFVPNEIMNLMGLFDNPSPCDVNVASFDGDLLSVDLNDVEKLVPASLIGSGLGSFIKPVSEDLSSSQMEGCDEVAGTSKLEVENAKLKAELASAIAIICGFNCEMGFYENLGNEEDQIGKMVNEMKERTQEALGFKDEYANQLNLMLDSKKEQCVVYEKRIRELEERLSEQYNQKQRNVSNIDLVNDDSNSNNNNNMDESSSATSASGMRQQSRNLEGGDENMMDLLSGTITTGNNETEDNDKEIKLEFNNNDNDNNNAGDERGPGLDLLREEILELKRVLEEKSMNLEESEGKIRVLSQEVENLNRELKHSCNLLDESQMNCAHLENCLHEAREEARTNKCTAERRSTEYEALRSSALKIHSLFERLRVCVNSPGVSGFADSLRSLSLSLASAAKKEEGEEFQQCIKVLSDKVGFMSHQSAELAERCSRMETAHGHLLRELEEKRDLVRNLYSKLQLEKQVGKEKIMFGTSGKFEISELAAFVRNPSGNYEAINRNCPNYYLSEESITLFCEQNPTQQLEYIIGQIVHIEGRVVESDGNNGSGTRVGSNPYGLPVGCEYSVVTVALLPDSVR